MDDINPDTRPDRIDTTDVELLLLADAERVQRACADSDLDAFTDAVFHRLGIDPPR